MEQIIKSFLADRFGYEDNDLVLDLVALLQPEISNIELTSYDNGHKAGFHEAEATFAIEYNNAFQNGYALGIGEGEQKGFEEGVLKQE